MSFSLRRLASRLATQSVRSLEPLRKKRLPRRRYQTLQMESLEPRNVLAALVVTSVADNGVGSLRDAIQQANTVVGADEISFDPSLFSTAQTITLTSGQLQISDDLTIIGPGKSQLAVSGDRANRVFEVNSGVTATVSGFTVRDGLAENGGGILSAGTLTVDNMLFTGNSASTNGGGIHRHAGSLTVSHTDFITNSAHVGAGISSSFNPLLPPLLITDSTFHANSAVASGGGLYGGKSTISKSSFTGNTAGNSAGAIYGEVTLVSSSLTDNSAVRYGGAIVIFSSGTILSSTLSGNSAGQDGGAVYLNGATSGRLILSHSTLSGNDAAGNGGGIWMLGRLNGSNNTIAENSAGYDGGGIYGVLTDEFDSVQSVMTNVTITNNRSNVSGSGGAGGGLFAIPSSYGALTLHNSIVAGNFNGEAINPIADDVSGTLNAYSAFNLIGAGGSGGLRDRSIDPVNSNQIGAADALLGSLGDYGGTTPTIPLLSGSPAIAGGNKSLAVDPNGSGSGLVVSGTPLVHDQRGISFPRTHNGTMDIGAFQSQLAPPRTTFTVMNTNDSGPGSLREFVELNNAIGGGNRIEFAISSASTINLTSGELLVVQDVTIAGPGADQLALSGNDANRVFSVFDHANIYDTSGGGVFASISGVTIKNGVATPVNQVEFSDVTAGGGIYMQFAEVVVRDCVLSNNSAYTGGAIFNAHGFLRIENSDIESNTATIGAISNSGVLVIDASTLSANSAITGGGIFNSGALTVRDSSFLSNVADMDGGGLFNHENNNNVTIIGSTFAGNTAGRDGGGVVFQSSGVGRLMVSNSTFSGNTANDRGGAIHVGIAGGGHQLVNITVSDNHADRGGGMFISSGLSGVRLSNSIIAENFASSFGPDLSGPIISRGYNLIGDSSGAFGSIGLGIGSEGDQIGDADNPISPLLALLGDYGGPTQTRPPLQGSPAINAGNNALALDPSRNPLTTDQRGQTRIQDGTVDVGAAEVPTLTITNTLPLDLNGDYTAPEGAVVQLNGRISGDELMAMPGFRYEWSVTQFAAGEAAATQHISSYASHVIEFSSEYESTGWSAQQALGESNVFEYADDPNAWSPLPMNGSIEFLTLGFDRPLYADGVTIREGQGNGFVTQVDLLDGDGDYHTVWAGIDPSLPGSVVDFQLNWERTDYLVHGVRIQVDADHDQETWEEIDSVQLHGWASPPILFATGNTESVSFTPNEHGEYLAILTVTDSYGYTLSASQEIQVTNVAPTIALVGNPTVNEGSTYTLSLGAVADPGDDTVTQYIVDWGDGAIETFSSAGSKTHVYPDDGPQPVNTIKVSLVDEDGVHTNVAAMDVTVLNVKPSGILVAGSALTGSGSNAVLTANVSFTDPGSDSWTASINYGDGVVQSVQLGTTRTFDLNHEYSQSGTYTVAITITDDEGGSVTKRGNTAIVIGTKQSDQIKVRVGSIIVEMNGLEIAHLEDIEEVLVWGGDGDDLISIDPAITLPAVLLGGDGNDWLVAGSGPTVAQGGAGNDVIQEADGSVSDIHGAFVADDVLYGGNVLIVGGTNADDRIALSPASGGGLQLSVNQEAIQSFTEVTRIVVFGQDGDDDLQVAGSIKVPAWLSGGEGNDRLKGGAANDILRGGAGDDLLIGGDGRDLLIGGLGADRLVGNAADDILVAGTATFENQDASLAAIMLEWGRADADFAARVTHLQDGGGLNGAVLVNHQTGHDDGAVDVLTGSEGDDLFLFTSLGDTSNRDKVTDMKTFEALFAEDLDFLAGT